ncbi:MAG: delta-aminolevulinic acid dehydratase [Planctomycetes bacterium RBG_16_43_13]|nr:MAG: delta-aminolevulinic acid dehydratase [Planctomycetes bacterium RBG_16_43_13]
MFKRFRQRRIDEATRMKYRETHLKRDDFIWPVFLVDGTEVKNEIKSMPEVYHYSKDIVLQELELLVPAGLKSVLLFGVPDQKGIEQAYDPKGIVQKAIPIIKRYFRHLEVITDVCLCSFTEDGHCHTGDNDSTGEILAKIAVSHALSGADIVAPSDMMDGRVYFIRKALNKNAFSNVKIMSYAAKYASNYYGPFRDAADCAPKTGDRKTYQMDPGNSEEAMEEIAADIEEGADSIIIKPALSYLDIVAKAKQRFSCPIAAYNVSGEYVMLKTAIQNSSAKEEIIFETLLSIKRAGANRIISYFTPYILKNIK